MSLTTKTKTPPAAKVRDALLTSMSNGPKNSSYGHSGKDSLGLGISPIKALVADLALRSFQASIGDFECDLEDLAELYAWPYKQIQLDSPQPIAGTDSAQCDELLKLFKPDDRVLCTYLRENTSEEIREAVSSVRRGEAYTVSSFADPARKQPGFSLPPVQRVQFIRRPGVHESIDDGWIFRMLVEEFGLKLLAVVDTAGWLTGWFEPIPEPLLTALAYWFQLLELSLDYCFTRDADSWLPRNDGETSLIYLNIFAQEGGAL